MSEEKNFAIASFAFAAITGFCIGGTALANVIGIPYISKRLSLSSAYILLQTIRNTIDFKQIFEHEDLKNKGFLTLGSSLMATCLIMINVVIFALPMSSTYITFSGLTGVTLFVFGFNPYNNDKLVTTEWLIAESLIWVCTPVISMVLAYLIQAIKDGEKGRIGKDLKDSFRIWNSKVLIVAYFGDESAVTQRLNHRLIKLSCDQTQIPERSMEEDVNPNQIEEEDEYVMYSDNEETKQHQNKQSPKKVQEQYKKANQNFLQKSISKLSGSKKKREQNQREKEQLDHQNTLQMYQQLISVDINNSEDMGSVTSGDHQYQNDRKSPRNYLPMIEEDLQENRVSNTNVLSQGGRQVSGGILKNSEKKDEQVSSFFFKKAQPFYHSEKSIKKIDKLFRLPLIISTCLLAFAHGSNEVNVSAPCGAMIFLLNSNESISDVEAYQGMAIGLISLILGVLTLGKRYLHKYRKKFMKTTLSNGFIANTSASICLLICSFFGYPASLTYLITPNIYLLNKVSKGKKMKFKKIWQGVLFVLGTVIACALFSLGLYYLFSSMDKELGDPHPSQDQEAYRIN
eukprot:403334582